MLISLVKLSPWATAHYNQQIRMEWDIFETRNELRQPDNKKDERTIKNSFKDKNSQQAEAFQCRGKAPKGYKAVTLL